MKRTACAVAAALLLSTPLLWADGRRKTAPAWTEVRKDDFTRNDQIEGDLRAIAFSDAKRGWAAGSNGLILVTKDGGESWTKQELPEPPENVPPRFRQALLSPNLAAALALDEERILIAGSASLLSADGGQTWAFVNVGTRNRVTDGALLPDRTAFITADNRAVASSGDGGKSWKLIAAGAGQSLITYEAIAFAPPENPDDKNAPALGWIVGTAGLILFSADRGQTWNEPENETGAFENLYDIQFTSPQDGWIVGQEAIILRTTDRGRAWKRVQNDAQKLHYDLYSAAFSSKNRKLGWIVGDGGKALVTKDGGETWPLAPTGVNYKLYAVAESPAGDAFAVGEWGVILKYNAPADPNGEE